MRGVARVVAGGAVAAAALAGLAAASQLPYTASPADAAEVRLAWRARVPRVEECRRLTAEEQAELPVHMRREEVCEGRVASYRLEVAVDGRALRSRPVEGAGARGDRPLYVFESIPLPAGRHDLRVSFTRTDAGGGPVGSAGTGAAAPAAGGPGFVPDRLLLRESLELGPREVVLVTYDPERRRLELRRDGSW